MNPYLDAILEAATHAKDVSINTQKLRAWTDVLAQEDPPIPDWRMPVFPETDDDTFVQFLGIGNALNYCFTDVITKQKYEAEYLGKQWRGAFGMWASLKRALDSGIPILDYYYFISLEPEDIQALFAGTPSLPLLNERVICLWSSALSMHDDFLSYPNLFEKCGYRAFNNGNGIVERLVRCDIWFHDASYFQPLQKLLQFYKRANLFVMMYHGRALASNGALPIIEDADDLTPPADYEVPKALRHLGILEYSPELAHDVDHQIEIPAHSRWEQEIRIQTVAAMRQLCALSGKPIAAVDFKVWLEGKTSPQPHHLTATTAY